MNTHIKFTNFRRTTNLLWPQSAAGAVLLIAGIFLAGAHSHVVAQDAIRSSGVSSISSGDAADQESKTYSTYKLVPTDLIAVSVFEEPELAVQSRVSEDGTVTLPLLGNVKVGGGTVKQAVDTITALLKQDYLVHPVVTIAVLEQTKGKLTVLGAVGRPGMIEMPAEGGIPIMEAIAMAGGFTRMASPSKVTVKRSGPGRENVFKVNGKDQATGAEKIFMVYPGDVITVGESIF